MRKNIKAEVEEKRSKAVDDLRTKKGEANALFSSVFETDFGKEVFKKLYDFAKCGHDMFVECKDEREFSYISGRQSMVLHILKILED